MHGFRILCQEDVLFEDPKEFYKLPEQLGEAIPQVIIAGVFYAMNKDYLDKYDTLFGLDVSTTQVSMIFSSMSILCGLFGACKSFFR